MTDPLASLAEALPIPARPVIGPWLRRLHPALGRAWRILMRGGFPFMPWPEGTPVRRLRHHCRLSLFARRPIWQRWLLCALMSLAWPVGALVAVLRCLSGLPADVRPVRVRDWGWRGWHMLLLALRDNVPPNEYVLHHLHDPVRRDWAAAAFYGDETAQLSFHLALQAGACLPDVQDKVRFADLCRRHGLPCIPTLAAYRGGTRLLPEVPFIPDQPVLWVKDLAGHGGAGAACWQRDGGLYREEKSGRPLAPEALEPLWRQRDCLVQPLLTAHPVLSALSTGRAVADFRVVSGIDRAGNVTIIAAQAQLGAGGSHPRWYILAAVGEDGALRNPLLAGYLPLTCHPDTGADLSLTVPFWPAALALVRKAHQAVPAFARFPLLGWDIAVTPDGPVLIETNVGWDGLMPQVGSLPFGQTALVPIALAWLGIEQKCG